MKTHVSVHYEVEVPDDTKLRDLQVIRTAIGLFLVSEDETLKLRMTPKTFAIGNLECKTCEEHSH
jgi:hypothetical protein